MSHLIIGKGRVGTTFFRYMRAIELDASIISHTEVNDIDLTDVKIIYLAIPDDAIEPFIVSHPILKTRELVHFSGSIFIEGVNGCHPLMSFNNEFYGYKKLSQVPFICDQKTINELIPEIINPSFPISKDDKAYYHSLCVMAGNFTSLLWNKFFTETDSKFNIPKEHSSIFFEQVMNNIKHCHKESLTGPLVRRDYKTINKNIDALNNDSYQDIYKAFVGSFEGINL